MNIILFDMDNTLVSADTGDLWGEFLDLKGLTHQKDKIIRRKLGKDYEEGTLDAIENFHFELSLLNKIPVFQRESLRDDFFEKFVKPKISKIGLELIENYKKQPNTTVILITATLSFIARPVADYAGVHDLIATELEKKDEIYTGIAGTPCLREGKLERFKTWLKERDISPQHTVLYSDSINDLPLLNFVTKPIIVDPDKYLKSIALQKNWELISFK